MKRDIILLAVCLCVLAGVNWLGNRQAVPASATVEPKGKQTLIPVSYTHLTLPTICSV